MLMSMYSTGAIVLWNLLQVNMTVHSRITKIDIDRFTVDLTTKTSDLVDKENQWKYVIIYMSNQL